jgi:hypothetical protein
VLKTSGPSWGKLVKSATLVNPSEPSNSWV